MNVPQPPRDRSSTVQLQMEQPGPLVKVTTAFYQAPVLWTTNISHRCFLLYLIAPIVAPDTEQLHASGYDDFVTTALFYV